MRIHGRSALSRCARYAATPPGASAYPRAKLPVLWGNHDHGVPPTGRARHGCLRTGRRPASVTEGDRFQAAPGDVAKSARVGLNTVYNVSAASGDETLRAIAKYLKEHYIDEGKLGVASGERFYRYAETPPTSV